MAENLSAKEVASVLDTDPKTFRRFVRSHVRGIGGTVGQDTPGRGGRYSFDADDMPAIADAFKAWRTGGGSMLVRFGTDTNADETEAGTDA